MPIRFLKAATPGTRHSSISDFSNLSKNSPEKKLTTWC